MNYLVRAGKELAVLEGTLRDAEERGKRMADKRFTVYALTAAGRWRKEPRNGQWYRLRTNEEER